MPQALQNQLYGGQASAWNFGAAYRIPDTNVNLSGTYQQGKASLQVCPEPICLSREMAQAWVVPETFPTEAHRLLQSFCSV